MLQCPKCKADTAKLIIPLGGKLSCRACTEPPKTKYNPRLNQTLHNLDGKTRVTVGKAYEIDSRIVCPDDKKVVLNRHTGKPTQY